MKDVSFQVSITKDVTTSDTRSKCECVRNMAK